MANVNKVIILGRVSRDIELKHTPSGTAVCDLGVVTNHRKKDDAGEYVEVPTWHSVAVWGRQAEICAEYLAKGREVFIEGRLQIESWEDKTTGEARQRVSVVAENVQLIGGKA